MKIPKGVKIIILIILGLALMASICDLSGESDDEEYYGNLTATAEYEVATGQHDGVVIARANISTLASMFVKVKIAYDGILENVRNFQANQRYMRDNGLQ